MSTITSDEMLRSIRPAKRAKRQVETGLRLVSPSGTCLIQRMWDNGCVLAYEDTPQLRGYVDIYDGDRHMFQCLIVAAEHDGDRVRCTFKRLTAVRMSAPVDYVLSPDQETEAEAEFAL